MALDPGLKIVLDQLAANPGPQLHELPVEQARAFFDAMQLPSPEVKIASVEDRRIPGPAGDIPVRIYRPEGQGPLPALVYFHGGGWVIGSIETHDASCRDLANRVGCVVVSVDYRLAPEHRYPAAAEDCYAATRWVAENAASLGIDAGRIAIGGDSAGGNLTAVVALMARDRRGPALVHQLLIYPVTDADFTRASYRENAEGYLLTTTAMEWFWGHYVPDSAQRTEAYAAPLRAKDLAGLPPAFVITAEFDPLRDEGEAYAKRLAQAGVATRHERYAGAIHGFFAMGMLSEVARRVVDDAADELRRVLGG
jgi:acetyl esterase/lipase